MADPRRRWYDNAPGPAPLEGRGLAFYVDRECILCSVCADLAPDNFRVSDDEDHDICYRQPATEAELAACYDAMRGCPVEAIGDDGLEAEDADPRRGEVAVDGAHEGDVAGPVHP